MCGLPEDLLDKANPDANIYSHNEEWYNNLGKRCPMYLTEIHDVDKDWSENEDECLARFHRIKTIVSLKEFIKAVTEEKYYRFVEIFP